MSDCGDKEPLLSWSSTDNQGYTDDFVVTIEPSGSTPSENYNHSNSKKRPNQSSHDVFVGAVRNNRTRNNSARNKTRNRESYGDDEESGSPNSNEDLLSSTQGSESPGSGSVSPTSGSEGSSKTDGSPTGSGSGSVTTGNSEDTSPTSVSTEASDKSNKSEASEGDTPKWSPTSSVSSSNLSSSTSPSDSSTASTGKERFKLKNQNDKTKTKKKSKKRSWLSRMCKSNPEDWFLLKAILWFPIGCGISLILYFLIIRKMDMEEKNKAVIGAAIGAVLALTFALSVQVRCTLCLVIPSFMGKAGRSYVTAFALIYLINGPITNIIANSKEIARALTCNSELLANHSREKYRLRLHPIEGAIGDWSESTFQIEHVAKSIKKAFSPLVKEIQKNEAEERQMKKDIKKVEKIEGEKKSTVDKIEKKHDGDKGLDETGEKLEEEWKKKLELRCYDTFSKGVLRCREKMGRLYSKCRDALWVAGYMMCWPLKITVFCKLVKLVPGLAGTSCDSMDVVSPGFGDSYLSARAVVDDLEEGMDVKVQYKMVGDPDVVDYTPVVEMRAATVHEVEKKSKLIQFILSVIAHILTFTFLLVFKSAYDYNGKYLTDVTFDNNYITSYFKHIDARRRAHNKPTLLPLKKFERRDIIDPMKPTLSKDEKGAISKGTGRLVLRIIIAAIICYMDNLMYKVMDIISRNSHVEYHQEGEHTIDIKVHGTGFMSALVRGFLMRFNTNRTLDKVTSNYQCLPNPEETDSVIIGFIFGTYILVWIFMYFESFGLRMRHVIASFFYRKREKKRVLHLYNEMYRRRIGYLTSMRKRIKKSLRKRLFQEEMSFLVAFQRRFPKCCGWLKFFKSAKVNCIICEDSQGPGFYLCPTEGCGVGYCKQCWKDVGKKCYACARDEEGKLTSDSDSDDSVDSYVSGSGSE